MGQQKIYDRVEHDGEQHLLLQDRDILGDVDLSWVQEDKDLKEVLEKLHDYVSTAAKWMWIETGVPVKVKKKREGFAWLVPDTRENSMKYKWLKSKVKKYEDRIIDTLNTYNRNMYEVLNGKEDQDADASTGESD